MARRTRTGQRQRGAGPQGATGKAGPRGPRGQRGPAGQATITRAEFNAAVDSINDNIRSLQVQLRRIADMQAELDDVKRAVARLSAQA